MADETFPPEPPSTNIDHPYPDDPRLNTDLHLEVQAALRAQAAADRQNAQPLDYINPAWTDQQRLNMRRIRQQVINDHQARKMASPPFRRGEG